MYSRNQYLQDLGLSPGATPTEVKQAYRTLSKQFHPDVSDIETAKSDFIRITEAYHFLTRVGPTPNKEPVNYDYNPQQQQYEAWRARARAKATRKANTREQMMKRHVQIIVNGFQYIVILSAIINTLWAADYFLPCTITSQEVITYKGKTHLRSSDYDIVILSDYIIKVPKYKGREIWNQNTVDLALTPILGYPMYIQIDSKKIEPYWDRYRGFGVLIPTILVMSALFLSSGERIERKLNLSVVMAFVLAFQYMVT